MQTNIDPASLKKECSRATTTKGVTVIISSVSAENLREQVKHSDECTMGICAVREHDEEGCMVYPKDLVLESIEDV